MYTLEPNSCIEFRQTIVETTRRVGSVRGVMQKGEVMVFPICWQIQKRRESHDQEEEYHK